MFFFFFFFQAEDGIRDLTVTGVQTCALPISASWSRPPPARRSRARLRSRRPRARTISCPCGAWCSRPRASPSAIPRSEEHTSELQSQSNLVCRLLLEKKKKKKNYNKQLT